MRTAPEKNDMRYQLFPTTPCELAEAVISAWLRVASALLAWPVALSNTLPNQALEGREEHDMTRAQTEMLAKMRAAIEASDVLRGRGYTLGEPRLKSLLYTGSQPHPSVVIPLNRDGRTVGFVRIGPGGNVGLPAVLSAEIGGQLYD